MRLSALLMIAMWLPVPVLASGAVRSPQQVLVQPGEPDRLVVRYGPEGDGGLFFSDDGGASWTGLCNGLFGLTGQANAVELASDGHVLVSAFGGLLEDDGAGCNWQTVPEIGDRWLRRMTRHPSDPDVVFGLLSDFDRPNAMMRRDASGTWTQVGPEEPPGLSDLKVTQLPGGGLRYYQLVRVREEMYTRDGGFPGFRTFFDIRHSDDEGATWTSFPFGGIDAGIELRGIDPTNPDRLLLSIEMPDEHTLHVSDDRGETFRELLTTKPLADVAVAADGRLWVGEYDGPLFSGRFGDESLSVADEELDVRCLTWDESRKRLYVCKTLTVSFMEEGVGEPVEVFDILTPAAHHCDDTDVVKECEDEWLGRYCAPRHYGDLIPALCLANYPDQYATLDAGSDAGPVEALDAASAPAQDAGTAPKSLAGDDGDSGCGCRTHGARSASTSSWGAIVLALCAARMTRRRTRRAD